MLDEEKIDFPVDSIEKMIDVLEKKGAPFDFAKHKNSFYYACKQVAHASNIRLQPYSKLPPHEKYEQALQELAFRSGFRYRQVRLRRQWWRYDNGPLLAFNKDDSKPCALIPHKDGYLLVDAEGTTPVTEELAAKIKPYAFYFYKRLPSHPLTLRDILRYTFRIIKFDFRRTLLLQFIMSVLGLAFPVATGFLFTYAIPFADVNAVWQVVIALIVNGMVISMFTLGQIISLFRLKLRANASLQAAVWDRLLLFSPRFFKKYDTGDLTNRAAGIDYIQQELTLTMMTSLISGVLSLISLALLFYLNAMITLAVIFLIAVMAVVTISLTLREIKYLRKHFFLLGKVYSLLLQFFTSISKVRVANSEKQVFRLWMDKFAAKTSLFLKAGKIGIIANIFDLVFTLFVTLIFFVFIISSGNEMTLGTFIIYNAAFTQLFAALTSVLATINQLVEIVPVYERIKPILKNTPESHGRDGIMPTISGRVEMENVIFRYPFNNTLVADHLSFTISHGQYVGIIGPSGAGKTTIIRLLIGFESPQSGNIRYDGHDISVLDLSYLRHQLGVVLQSSSLMPGTIIDNIIGINTGLSTEDAWVAAKQVKIAQDIEAMPMGMKTIITEGGQTLSMGQRQRILLARALAKKPTILILDEAMSGLDDTTQNEIRECIDNLAITRIIITQRPQFLEKADIIYLIENGKIITQGSYHEMSHAPAFERLRLSVEE